jgi:hypothetical protein
MDAQPVRVVDHLAGANGEQAAQALAVLQSHLGAVDEAERSMEMAIIFVGDGLRDALDPYGRR